MCVFFAAAALLAQRARMRLLKPMMKYLMKAALAMCPCNNNTSLPPSGQLGKLCVRELRTSARTLERRGHLCVLRILYSLRS